MSVPKELQYTKSHEWVKLLPSGNAQMGITDHAQEAMGDLVYIDLPEAGDSFAKGDNLAVVESVKATSDVYAPINGTVEMVNEEVMDNPAAVNEDCYTAWFVELSDISAEGLLSAEEYEQFLTEEE